MENILQISGVASAILFLSLIDKKYANYWTILLYKNNARKSRVQNKRQNETVDYISARILEWKKCLILFLKPIF